MVAVLEVGAEVKMEAAAEVGTLARVLVGAEASGWPVRAGASGGQVGVGPAASGRPAGAGRSVSMSAAGETPECVSRRVNMSERPC